MSSNSRLTFGDDGSAHADVAWLWINNHRWTGWALDVVSVLPAPTGLPISSDDARLRVWHPTSARTLFSETGFGQVEYLTSVGDPRAVLGGIEGSSLLVVGARGTGLLKGLHLGSTAEFLAQVPPAPLMIVRSAVPVHRIVVCVDGSVHARAAADALLRMPWLPGAQVTVLCVEEAGVEGEIAAQRVAREFAALGAHADLLVRGPGGGDAFYTVRGVIDDVLLETSAELVVIGAAGRSDRWFLGALSSTATSLAHHAPCSVLLACAPR